MLKFKESSSFQIVLQIALLDLHFLLWKIFQPTYDA